ncbi:MAG: alanine racemase, partial [Pseudomonadota bacterium]
MSDTLVDLETPALLVERERLEANLVWAAGLTRAAGVSLRPHMKTHKSPHLARRQREHGIVGVTTATVAEAEVFVRAGFEDVFIAYPMVGPARVGRLAALNVRARVACGVDHRDQLAPLDRAADQAGVRVGVRLELDSGHHRCGLPPGPELLELGRAAVACEHLQLRGVYTHAGQAYGGESPEAIAALGRAEGRIAV